MYKLEVVKHSEDTSDVVHSIPAASTARS